MDKLFTCTTLPVQSQRRCVDSGKGFREGIGEMRPPPSLCTAQPRQQSGQRRRGATAPLPQEGRHRGAPLQGYVIVLLAK